MKLQLNINKTVNQNAAVYFEKAKKAKKKIEGAKKAVDEAKKKLITLEKNKEEFLKKEQERKEKEDKLKSIKREWYEKFRWFLASDNTLIIGGRDATTNEIVVKKHLEKDESVFHTDMTGSPFVIIKGKATKENKQEAALFCAIYSKAWKRGLSTTEVYSIKGEGVKKELGLPKGSFMMYGDREYFQPTLELAIGNYEGKVMAGPKDAIKKHCKDYVILTMGNEKTSDIAKKIQKIIDCDLDEIIRAIPQGSKLKK